MIGVTSPSEKEGEAVEAGPGTLQEASVRKQHPATSDKGGAGPARLTGIDTVRLSAVCLRCYARVGLDVLAGLGACPRCAGKQFLKLRRDGSIWTIRA